MIYFIEIINLFTLTNTSIDYIFYIGYKYWHLLLNFKSNLCYIYIYTYI